MNIVLIQMLHLYNVNTLSDACNVLAWLIGEWVKQKDGERLTLIVRIAADVSQSADAPALPLCTALLIT